MCSGPEDGQFRLSDYVTIFQTNDPNRLHIGLYNQINVSTKQNDTAQA